MKATVHRGREQDRDGLINVATWPDRDDAWGWGGGSLTLASSTDPDDQLLITSLRFGHLFSFFSSSIDLSLTSDPR